MWAPRSRAGLGRSALPPSARIRELNHWRDEPDRRRGVVGTRHLPGDAHGHRRQRRDERCDAGRKGERSRHEVLRAVHDRMPVLAGRHGDDHDRNLHPLLRSGTGARNEIPQLDLPRRDTVRADPPCHQRGSRKQGRTQEHALDHRQPRQQPTSRRPKGNRAHNDRLLGTVEFPCLDEHQ
jgi:hypothetical protein